MSRIPILFALVALAAGAKTATHIVHRGICELDFCLCQDALHPALTSVNCTVPRGTTLTIGNMDLPFTTIELNIEGSEAVMFSAGAFNSVKDMRRIEVSHSKLVLFRPFAAVELSVLNLALKVTNCDLLRFEKRVFNNLRGPMTVTITDCETVSVEGDTFSWLLNLAVSNVRELTLGEGSFTLDPTAANVGEHGPGMTIELKNTMIPEFTKSTFGSSAAKLYMEGVDIHAIRSGAFSANTYNIVMAINCSIHLIEEEAFSENSLINYLTLEGCKIQHLASKALRSAIANINIDHTRFDNVATGAVNTTVASVTILNSEFHKLMEKGFEFSSWNILQMENNSFDELPANAIAAPGASIHKLTFNNNEIETMHPDSLSFIGKAAATRQIEYQNNYYGRTCYCNISSWLATALGTENGEDYEEQSYCTVSEFFARCYNVPDQNMLFRKFLREVCVKGSDIQCEQFKSKNDGALVEIKNPRFPHKVYNDNELSDRNKKVIGIVIVSILGCVIIAMLFSLFRWWRRGRGDCANLKTILISSNTACGSLCGRLCSCGNNLGLDNARSISQLSVVEYSERHRLNETRPQELTLESNFQEVEIVPTEDKGIQTLPEELTKELLEKLKERLDNPENYVEAREMIEHLYELTKLSECDRFLSPTDSSNEENIYDLPYAMRDNAAAPVSRNKKKMVNMGTKTPSLDKLLPLSPYYRQTALSHEYFEPKDLAVHLYAEIANNDKKKTMLGSIPDVIAEQAIPRGPYLQAKLQSSSSSSSSPVRSTSNPRPGSTIKSNASNSSSKKMMNRPLPEKPVLDPGEGTSFKLG